MAVRIRLWYLLRRLKRGPVDSRVGMFPEVFGMANGNFRSTSESTEGRSKPGVGWRLTSCEFGDDRCVFIE